MIDPPLPGASIETGPSDWQILQQETNGVAALELAGVHRTDAPEYRVEVRVVCESNGAPVSAALDWQPAQLLPGNRWRMTLTGLPAGGLYRVETRVWRDHCADTRPMRGDYLHHLGVGDLWVIAGQSNASGTGTGYVDDPPTLGVHLFGSDERWKLACHPLEDATRSLHTITVHGVFQAHSPWLAFGRLLLSQLNYPVGLIPTALGGSPLSAWMEGEDLYVNMLDMVRLAGGRVRGMVWYQGESDCAPRPCEDYIKRFTRFVAAARRDLGAPELPILTAQLGRYAAPADEENHRSWTRLREAQRQAAQTLLGVELIPTVDLSLCDEIHLSAPANVLLGQRFAREALRAVYGRNLSRTAIALRGAEVAKNRSVVVLKVERPAAGWCWVGQGPDFVADDEAGLVAVTQVAPYDDGGIELHLARGLRGEAVIHAHWGCNPPASLRDRDQRPLLGFSVNLPPPKV